MKISRRKQEPGSGSRGPVKTFAPPPDRETNTKERLIEQIQQNPDVLRDDIKLIDFFPQTDQTERTSDPDLFAKDDDGTLLLIIVKEHVDSLGDIIDQFRSTVEEYGGVDNAGVILVTPRSDGVAEIEEDWIEAYQI